jgi:hypothetical protein
MACSSCSQSAPFSTGYLSSNCTSLGDCFVDAACVGYIGPNLTCSGINTNDRLDVILQKIDPLLCAAGGDYSTYNTFCLAPINSAQEFVETISEEFCDLQTAYNTFTGTTFPAYQATITAALTAITSPNITCTSAGVTSADTLVNVLTKYCTKFASIDTALNPSTANWSSCYSVSPAPTTVIDGFNTLIAQICLLKTAVTNNTAALPTFNNTGSCLPTPGASDSLVDTVNKIKTRLCQTGTIDNSTITWGCVTAPTGNQNLQDALQNVITLVTANTKIIPTEFSSDFTVTNVDDGNLCLGKHIALATPSTQDRFVAATSSDSTPGVLQDKLVAGTNLALDYSTTPGKVIINATGGGGTGAGTVLADNTDSTQGYLIDKLEVGTAGLGITVTPTLDTTDSDDHKVSFVVNVNPVTLFTALLTALSNDSGLKALFCAAINSCPSPCSAAMNVQVTYQSGTTTTTTSTTSTSSTTSTTTTSTSTTTTTTL